MFFSNLQKILYQTTFSKRNQSGQYIFVGQQTVFHFSRAHYTKLNCPGFEAFQYTVGVNYPANITPWRINALSTAFL